MIHPKYWFPKTFILHPTLFIFKKVVIVDYLPQTYPLFDYMLINMAKLSYLQCDGFAGYETAFKTNPDVRLVNCMVHIRRHLEQALDENRPMAEHDLKEIQHLYKIEHMCDDAGLSPDERKAKRQELARPIMEAMKLWMETEGVKYSESVI